MVLLHLCLVGALSLSGVVSSGGSDWSALGQPVIGEVEAGYVLQSGFWYWMLGGTGIVELEPEVEKPVSFKVWPNPARKAVWIEKPDGVVVRVYDALGRLVHRLVDQEQGPGAFKLSWDGRDGDGRRLPAGVYFLRLEAAEHKAIQKVVLMR